tara:strand:+ start:944 stop:1534 length:591 start_codon:yes stop_codon:yes gene_type:complete
MTINKNHHNVYHEFLSPLECERLSAFVLVEEPRVMAIDNPFQHADSPYKGLTGQHTVYNWLSHPTLQVLNIPQRLFDLPDFENTSHIAIQCWMNVLRQTEKIPTHSHGENQSAFYAINIFLSGNPTTGTYYEGEHTINTQGEIHICSNNIEHKVPSQLFREPRISMAMDVFIDETSINEFKWELENSEIRLIEYYK